MTPALPRIVVFHGEGLLEVDDVLITAGVPTEVTAAIAERLAGRDDVEIQTLKQGQAPPANTQQPGTTPVAGDENNKEGE